MLCMWPPVIESVGKSLGAPVFFMGLDKVKFRKPVVPGDQLIFEVQIIKFRSKVVKASGKAFVKDNVVAEAELMATLG